MVGLPTGTVTFLFGDVEGSTELLERQGAAYADELAAHRSAVRAAVSARGGEIVDQRGEEVFAAFATADRAVATAVDIQRRHADRVVRVRIGLHTGEPALTGEGYLGLDVHRAARICAAGHGGQILLSDATRALVADRAVEDLGDYLLKGISAPERIYQLLEPGLPVRFAPLRTLPAVPARRLLPPRRARQATLEQLAWSTRARLPATPKGERAAVSRLARALSVAARASQGARRFSDGVDRRVLEHRHAAYVPMSVRSHRAAGAVESAERQLALLDAVEAHTLALEQAARRTPTSADEIERATDALDNALEQARSAIGTATRRTRLTMRRGIHRLGDEYVVASVDETGIEHLNAFGTMREARAFRLAAKLARENKASYRKLDLRSHAEVLRRTGLGARRGPVDPRDG
jgi:class 3 adenylate cyclase